jgi:hypothetical protein
LTEEGILYRWLRQAGAALFFKQDSEERNNNYEGANPRNAGDGF